MVPDHTWAESCHPEHPARGRPPCWITRLNVTGVRQTRTGSHVCPTPGDAGSIAVICERALVSLRAPEVGTCEAAAVIFPGQRNQLIRRSWLRNSRSRESFRKCVTIKTTNEKETSQRTFRCLRNTSWFVSSWRSGSVPARSGPRLTSWSVHDWRVFYRRNARRSH